MKSHKKPPGLLSRLRTTSWCDGGRGGVVGGVATSRMWKIPQQGEDHRNLYQNHGKSHGKWRLRARNIIYQGQQKTYIHSSASYRSSIICCWSLRFCFPIQKPSNGPWFTLWFGFPVHHSPKCCPHLDPCRARSMCKPLKSGEIFYFSVYFFRIVSRLHVFGKQHTHTHCFQGFQIW